MLERLIHEPLARVIGQPLLTLWNFNKIDLIDLILLYIFNPFFGVFYMTSRPGWVSKTLTHEET